MHKVENIREKTRRLRSFLAIPEYLDDVNSLRSMLAGRLIPVEEREAIRVYSGGVVACSDFQMGNISPDMLFRPLVVNTLPLTTPVTCISHSPDSDIMLIQQTTYGRVFDMANVRLMELIDFETDPDKSSISRLESFCRRFPGMSSYQLIGTSSNPTAKISLPNGVSIFVKSYNFPSKAINEARVLRYIDSKGLVGYPSTALPYELPNNTGILAMEWLDGYFPLLDRLHTLSPSERDIVIRSTLGTLIDLHLIGVAHGELSWNQVMINDRLDTSIIDFEEGSIETTINSKMYKDWNVFFSVMLPEMLGVNPNGFNFWVGFSSLFGNTQEMNRIRNTMMNVMPHQIFGGRFVPSQKQIRSALLKLASRLENSYTIDQVIQAFLVHMTAGRVADMTEF